MCCSMDERESDGKIVIFDWIRIYIYIYLSMFLYPYACWCGILYVRAYMSANEMNVMPKHRIYLSTISNDRPESHRKFWIGWFGSCLKFSLLIHEWQWIRAFSWLKCPGFLPIKTPMWNLCIQFERLTPTFWQPKCKR